MSEPARKSPWRWVRRFFYVVFGFIACLVVGLLAIRAYFDDERLRALIESQGTSFLKTDVKLAKLELRLGSEVTIEGFCIGPPPGFTRNVLCIEHAHVAWQLRPLASKELIIPDLSARGISVCLEQNEHGTNIEALHPTAKEDTEPTPEPAPQAKEPLKQPDIAMRVVLQHLEVTDFSAEVIKPDMSAAVDKMGMAGSFEAFHEAMALDMWMGLGSREGEGTSKAHFTRPGTELTSSQRGGLALRSTGFGDIALTFDFAATTDMSAPYALPTLVTKATARATVNLLEGKAALETASFQLGKSTKAELAFHAADVMSAPTVVIDTLRGTADLGELSPIVAAVMPGTHMRGRVTLAAEPMTIPIADAANPSALTTILSAKADNVRVTTMGYDADGVDATMTLGLASGIVAFHAGMTMIGITAPQGSAAGLTATLELTTPIAPWLDASQNGELAMIADAKVEHADAPAAVADGIATTLKLNGPIAMLRGGASTSPLFTHTTFSLASATAQGNTARGVSATTDTKQHDLMATNIDMSTRASIDSITSALPQGNLTLPRMTAALKMSRRNQSFDVPLVDMTMGRIMHMHGNAKVDAALGPAPRIRSFVFDLEPTSIPELIALAPRTMRPPATIAGSMRAHVSAQGTVPYVELTKAAQAPYIPPLGDVWGATITAYMRFANDWLKRLDKGLSFSGAMTFDIDDLAYSDAQAALDGGHVGVSATLEPHGPATRMLFTAANIKKPHVMHDVRFEWTSTLEGAHARTQALGVIGSLTQPGFAEPFRDTALEMTAHYDFSGDAVLDRFAVVVPALGTRFEARAMIKAPVDVVIARSWEQPGLPGVSIDSAYELRVASREPMAVGAPDVAVSGELSSRGSFTMSNGEAVLAGDMRMNGLSAKAGDNELENMSGVLPFDIRLAFDGRVGATPLARDLSFGEVSLITGESGATSDARPAYYDRLREYQHERGITAKRIRSGPYAVENLVLDGGMANGRLTADTMSMHLLGGDVIGNMAFRLANDRSISGDMDMKVSNIDASFFPALSLTPGPESEMNADAHMTFGFAPHRRDFAFNMNVTKIGSKTLDRFLQLLDPEEKNDSLQRTRGQLKFVRINNVAMWVRYENLNMDIDVTTFLRIPFTNIGFPNIERELLRRYSISEQLDFYLQPTIDKTIAPLLGWHD